MVENYALRQRVNAGMDPEVSFKSKRHGHKVEERELYAKPVDAEYWDFVVEDVVEEGARDALTFLEGMGARIPDVIDADEPRGNWEKLSSMKEMKGRWAKKSCQTNIVEDEEEDLDDELNGHVHIVNDDVVDEDENNVEVGVDEKKVHLLSECFEQAGIHVQGEEEETGNMQVSDLYKSALKTLRVYARELNQRFRPQGTGRVEGRFVNQDMCYLGQYKPGDVKEGDEEYDKYFSDSEDVALIYELEKDKDDIINFKWLPANIEGCMTQEKGIKYKNPMASRRVHQDDENATLRVRIFDEGTGARAYTLPEQPKYAFATCDVAQVIGRVNWESVVDGVHVVDMEDAKFFDAQCRKHYKEHPGNKAKWAAVAKANGKHKNTKKSRR